MGSNEAKNLQSHLEKIPKVLSPPPPPLESRINPRENECQDAYVF